MIVIPFTCSIKQVSDALSIYTIQILCEGGQKPWTEDNQPLKKVLEPNDIVRDIIDLPAGRLLLQVPDLH